MLNRLMLALTLPFFISCSSASKTTVANPKSAVIFIPGFYGTALKETKTGDRFFITASNYFFGGDAVSLQTEQLATPKAPLLEVDGILESVSTLFGLINIDVYGGFIKDLKRMTDQQNSELVLMPYDWRGDLSDDVKILARKVQELKARGIPQVTIVAHSMGCMIAAYYLAYGDQEPSIAQMDWRGGKTIDKAVLMAGPYRGVFSIFRNMQTGAKIGSNRSYMPAETVASLPSGYDLLPFPDFHFIDHQMKSSSFTLDDVKEWQTRKLGLLHRDNLDADVKSRRLIYLTKQLEAAKSFSDRLTGNTSVRESAPKSLRILQIVGHGHLTVDTAFQDASGGIQFDSEVTGKKAADERSLYIDGDGTVTTRSGRLPEAFVSNATVMQTTSPHDKIFEDKDFQKALATFLR